MFRITELLSYLATLDELRASWLALAPRLKMFYNFVFLQSDMVFGIVNAFSGIVDAAEFPMRKVARLGCFSCSPTLNSGQ